MLHHIYKITTCNDKQYIGYTSRPPQIRLQEHLKMCRKRSSKTKLYRTLRKHGLKKFEKIKSFQNELDALIFEILYIKNNKDLLNTSLGGEGKTIKVSIDDNGNVTKEPRTSNQASRKIPLRRKISRNRRRKLR